MPDSPCYEVIHNRADLIQGDIIAACVIPIPPKSLYNAALEGRSSPPDAVDLIKTDVIVLSQSCNLVNEKIQTVIVGSVWSLQTLVDADEYFHSKDSRESLRQGREPPYHLLHKHVSSGLVLPISVVDFHRIYSLPKEYLATVAVAKSSRLRLLPPYREHLSQAFARYFMRVGLPQDISKEEVKNTKPVSV
jgi:hypothetical protein